MIFSGGAIRDLVFENVTIGGEIVESQDHFYTNEFVYDLHFHWYECNHKLNKTQDMKVVAKIDNWIS